MRLSLAKSSKSVHVLCKAVVAKVSVLDMPEGRPIAGFSTP